MVDGCLSRLHRWLLPEGCAVCGALADGRLCAACRDDLPWLGAGCACCALPLPGAPRDSLCGRCQRRPPAFDATLAAFAYAAPVDRLIHGLKYGHQLSAARILADLMCERLTGAHPVDRLIPMPLHRARLRHRGFNQALEIARPLARRLKLSLDYDIADRVRNTAPQTELDRSARRRNVRNAFVVHERLAGERVAVLDDVMTSGATAESFARTLKHAGAKHVQLWIVARAI